MATKNNDDLARLNGAGIIAPIIIDDQSIEPVLNVEMAGIAQEKFMNEIVEVTINSSGAENEEPHVVFNVNGINQPFFRDVPTPCRRMFAEVLARCKKTTYTQKTDPFDMTRTEMVAKTVFAYPFSMIDQNPKGQSWLRAVKAEAA